MRRGILVSLCLWLAGCASLTPTEYADSVAAMPGRKPLRVGVVVLGTERVLPEAFAEAAAMPGGAAPMPAVGTLYAEQTVLPDSLPGDEVVDTLQRLGAFTDVVLLPFDSRGIASRQAAVQRVQDRVWRTAIAQELDALLVIEGLRDGGLRWSSESEGLFTLDTALWWLVWPIGLWIPDRTYTPDCALVAEMFLLGDRAADPQPIVITSTATPQSLAPWERANTPLLGLFLPPAWVGDDPDAVTEQVSAFARQMLPIELVRQIKQAPQPGPDADITLRAVDGFYEIEVGSMQEVAEATIVGLPRGALTDATTPSPMTVPIRSEIVQTPAGLRHASRGRVEREAVEQSGRSLLRVVVTLVSGETVSRTWSIHDLPR